MPLREEIWEDSGHHPPKTPANALRANPQKRIIRWARCLSRYLNQCPFTAWLRAGSSGKGMERRQKRRARPINVVSAYARGHHAGVRFVARVAILPIRPPQDQFASPRCMTVLIGRVALPLTAGNPDCFLDRRSTRHGASMTDQPSVPAFWPQTVPRQTARSKFAELHSQSNS